MKNKKTIWITVLVLCVMIVIAGAGFIIYSLSSHSAGREDFTPTQAASQSETAAAPTSAPATAVPETRAVTRNFGYQLAELGDFSVDFDELEAINSDIYAWIYIPNTNVDYPVVRSSSDGDDSFYLEHNIYRQYQFSGSIYSEVQNHPDFHDPVTVLYGHNMLNGSMFASLHNFEDEDFFSQNTTAFILTKNKVYTYLIYAAYTYDDRHILNSNFFEDKTVFQDYLDATLDPHSYNANVREGVTLTTDDRILVLSTCTNGAANTRYLVQGVLASEQIR